MRMSEDAMSLEQWVNRDIVPIESLEDLKGQAHEKWRIVENMLNNKKQETKNGKTNN